MANIEPGRLLFCVFAILLLPILISCGGKDLIDGKWKQQNGSEVLSAKGGQVICNLGGRKAWSGITKKISDNQFDIELRMAGVPPMRAEIKGKTLTLKRGAGEKVIATYERTE